jgi:DNA-binding NtrC family response regulator
MLPRLRERKGDIPALAEHSVRTFAAGDGKSIHRISDELLNILKRHE